MGGEVPCPLEIPLVRVLLIQAAREPERTPCIEAPSIVDARADSQEFVAGQLLVGAF
jgi:hypothetical protein